MRSYDQWCVRVYDKVTYEQERGLNLDFDQQVYCARLNFLLSNSIKLPLGHRCSNIFNFISKSMTTTVGFTIPYLKTVHITNGLFLVHKTK